MREDLLFLSKTRCAVYLDLAAPAVLDGQVERGVDLTRLGQVIPSFEVRDDYWKMAPIRKPKYFGFLITWAYKFLIILKL